MTGLAGIPPNTTTCCFIGVRECERSEEGRERERRRRTWKRKRKRKRKSEAQNALLCIIGVDMMK